MKTAIAFAPGHISGFFQPMIDAETIDERGSRGAGVCITHGATSKVLIREADEQCIRIQVNGKTGVFPVTMNAVKLLVGNKLVEIDVDVRLDLPISQGFGMSAASALSTSLALAHLLNKPRSAAIQTAHHAEVQNFTGLGDVYASSLGGFEIRKKPGIPPFGKIITINKDQSIQLGLFQGDISTSKILTNKIEMKRIAKLGNYCTDQVLKNTTIESIMKYSLFFTQKSRLAPKEILQVIKEINEYSLASMCMLGHSVFTLGNDKKVRHIISQHANVINTTVDTQGARIINTLD